MQAIAVMTLRKARRMLKRCTKHKKVLLIASGILMLTLTSLCLSEFFSQESVALFEFVNYNRTSRWGPFPMILHQTYANETVTNDYEQYIRGCLRLNPQWKYFLWRDEDMMALVQDHFPWFLNKFRGFRTKIERADAIRYMALYHFGGIYLDMDVECINPFYPALLKASPAFLDQERRDQVKILYGREVSVMNSAMGSVPRHPFFLKLLQAIMAVPRSASFKPDLTTGPSVLTKVYLDWVQTPMQSTCPVALLEPLVFSPMVDDGAHKYVNLCNRFLNKSAIHIQVLNRQMILEACKTVLLPTWKIDATDYRFTVGRHWYTHLGYHNNRTAGHFDIRSLVPSVQMYQVHRMEPLS